MGATVEDVRARAKRLFRTEQGASAFLDLPCTALDGVPAELAARGRADEVLTYLRRLELAAPPNRLKHWVPGGCGY